MRSQNIKYSSSRKVGGVSCLSLLLLTFLAVNPFVGTSAFAEGEGETNEASEEVASNDIPPQADVSVQSDVTSTVGISFSPARYYAELSPTDNVGQSARIDLQTTIYVYNSGGYSVYLKSDNPNLVGEKDSSNFIPGAATAKSYTDMDVNTWGYAWKVDEETVPNDAVYKAVTVSGNGDRLAENTSDDIEVDTRTIALSFATKINDEMPADTYSNTMMLSVVSSPREVVTWKEITTMQEMTSKVCDNADMGATKQLKDVRDGKFYWVTKLADGKCWMTQNLDLDLSTATKLTSDTSDVPAAGWTPGFTTATTATKDTVNANSQTQTRSWSLGNYRMKDSIAASGSDCGYPKNSAANCTSQFEAYTTPTSQNGDEDAHYILGNHYQWNAATAGTGGSITSGTATNSICPKGWRLPTSTSTGEFQALVTALGAGSDVSKLTGSPFYGVRGGYVHQDTSFLFRNAGYESLYWSSTPHSSANSAYNLYFYGTSNVSPSDNSSRQRGYSVRCVAR